MRPGARMSGHVRNNAVGYVALFFALSGGVAWATHPGGANTISSGDIINSEIRSEDIRSAGVQNSDLGPDSVGSGKIADGGVRGADVLDGSVTGTDVAADSLTGSDINEATLSPAAGQAGGDLAGNYPNPMLRPSENWHYIEPTATPGGEPDFENGWANSGGFDSRAAFFKDRFGAAHLQGLVTTSNSNPNIVELPANYRPCGRGGDPYHDLHFPLLRLDTSGNASVVHGVLLDGSTTPTLQVTSTNGGSTISLDGVSWRADGCS